MKQKPLSVTVIGVICILWALSNIMGAIMWVSIDHHISDFRRQFEQTLEQMSEEDAKEFMNQLKRKGKKGAGFSMGFRSIFVMDTFTTVKYIELPVAALMLVSAVYFLKLRAWGRAALEVSVWLEAIITLVSTFIMETWVLTGAFEHDFIAKYLPEFEHKFNMIFAISMVIGTVLWLTLTGVILWFLRSAKVREAMAG